jgi:hypothetical protein
MLGVTAAPWLPAAEIGIKAAVAADYVYLPYLIPSLPLCCPLPPTPVLQLGLYHQIQV